MPSNDRNYLDIGICLVIGFAVAALLLAFMLLYALALFTALVLTTLYLFAWDEDYSIGNLTISFDEGGPFIARGFAGAFIIPAFALFCGVVFRFRIAPDMWIHLMMGGYALGSVGVLILQGLAEADAAPQAAITIDHEPTPQLSPPKSGFIPARPPAATVAPTPHTANDTPACTSQSFTFATWDDEEELRKRSESNGS